MIADSHLETPYDPRDDIFETDMAIFKAQIEAGILDAMMPAHVVFLTMTISQRVALSIGCRKY